MSARWKIAASALALAACAPPPVWNAVSPDLAVRVSVQEQHSRSCVRVGDASARCHEAVSLSGLTLSGRGGHLAYPARAGDRWMVIHDGRAGPEWEGVGPPVLSPDGTRVAYPAETPSGWSVVADGKPGATFDAIVAGSLAFDSSGARLGYVARRGSSSIVVIDDVEGPAWVAASRPVFSADGSHWAYAAQDRNGWFVVAGSSRAGPFDTVRELAWPSRAADSLPSYIVRSGDAEAVVLAGVAQQWHARVSSLALDAAGRTWGYIADSGEVIVNGAPVTKETAAADLAIADDGSAFAYVAARDGARVIVVEGGRLSFDVVVPGTLQFLPGGHAWACLAGDRRQRDLFVVVDGRRTSQRVEWTELVRIAGLPDPSANLRAVVAARARLALAER